MEGKNQQKKFRGKERKTCHVREREKKREKRDA